MDVIECDVRITKDGEIIVFHDADFQRICQTDTLSRYDQKVLETNFSDLPLLKESMPISFSHDGSLKYKRKEGDQNCLSKLDDVFKVIPPDQVVQIEIKD